MGKALAEVQRENVLRRIVEVREYCKQNQEQLTAKVKKTLTNKGCQVIFVTSMQEAKDYLISLAGGQTIVNSNYYLPDEAKEILTELKNEGLKIINTDFKDYIVDSFGSIYPWISSDFDLIRLVNEIKRDWEQEEVKDALKTSKVDCKKEEITTDSLIQDICTEIRAAATTGGIGTNGAEAIVAETGSIIIQEYEGNIRIVSNMPSKSVIFAKKEDIVPTLEDGLAVVRSNAIEQGKKIGKNISIITGPSRTGDIEFVIVKGMHGPQELHILFI